MTTTNKPMTGEQLDELMTVAVNMQRDSEKVGERPAAMFAYAVQVAVLELRKVRDDAAALAVENAGLKHSTPDLQTMMTALDAFFADEEVPERAMLGAYKVLRNAVPTPATDAFLDEVRAQAIMNALESLDGVFDTDYIMEANGISYEDAEQRTAGALAVNKALANAAFELRKGASE